MLCRDKFDDEKEYELIGDISELKSRLEENGDSNASKTNDVDQKKHEHSKLLSHISYRLAVDFLIIFFFFIKLLNLNFQLLNFYF